MSKFTLVLLFLVLSLGSLRAFEPVKGSYAALPIVYPTQSKYRAFSLQITNPLSGASKIGGVVEFKIMNSSFNIGFTDYYGVYLGKQYKFEYEKYINTRWRNEYFWYVKVLGGTAQYESDKLSMFGDKSTVLVGPLDYYGGGAGFGRRFNFNHICVLVNAGLKYVALPENLSDQNREYFRVFYATGPGSIMELNFRIGYQF